MSGRTTRTLRPAAGSAASPWVQRTVDANTHVWADVAMSQSGAIIVAVDSSQNGGGTGSLWISTNNGVTWAASSGAGSRKWQSVSISSDGSHILAGFQGDGSTAGSAGIALSTNGGSSWSTPTLSFNATSGLKDGVLVAISGDGTKMLVGDTGFFEMWLSVNSGSSFPTITVPTVPSS